jgi:SET domain-containing protein
VKRAVPARSRIHGWGLFARERIAAGETVDETPLLFLETVPDGLDRHVYSFFDGRIAAPLGDGVLVNSADDPNAEFEMDLRRRVVVLVARRDIAPGDEVTIAYD